MATAITAVQETTLRTLFKTITNGASKPLTNEQIDALWQKGAGKELDSRVTEDKLRQTIRLYEAVAPQVTEDEWVEWHVSGELPIVKLTPEQMENARGGTISGAIFAGFALGTLIVGTACWLM